MPWSNRHDNYNNKVTPLTIWDVKVAQAVQLHDLLYHYDNAAHQIILAKVMRVEIPRKKSPLEMIHALLSRG